MAGYGFIPGGVLHENTCNACRDGQFNDGINDSLDQQHNTEPCKDMTVISCEAGQELDPGTVRS
eukprot:SAG11_NODE_2792_length_2967_cov_3.635983_2_plen_64_part_00